MPVTQKDIAMLMGISRQAVAAALEGDGSSRVSARTREKVQKLARELNYIPNAAARKLRGGDSRTIGILAPSGMPHSNTVYAEVCHILRSSAYTVLTMDHAAGELPQLCHQLASCGVCGIIVMDCINTPSKLLPMPDLPIVFCRTKLGWSDIDTDKELTGYLGTKHLLDHGYGRVDFLSGHGTMNSRREQGWKRALQEAGSTGEIISMSEYDGNAARLISRLQESRVRAMFCSNDFLAAKLMRALSASGIRVPEDIALVGCDGFSFVEFTTPSLTTVVQPVHELAQQCVDMLLHRIKEHIHGIILERAVIPPRLWLGGSCGCADHAPELLYQLNTTGNLEKDYRLNFNVSPWEVISTEVN